MNSLWPITLSHKALKKGLYTKVVGRRILHYKELSSTMDKAAEEARTGTIEGTVILCDQPKRWVEADFGDPGFLPQAT